MDKCGNHKLSDLKTMNPDLFDWEHSSRYTGDTVIGLRIFEDGTFDLPIWLGLTPRGYTRDKRICTETDKFGDDRYKSVAIALEFSNGEWFWMHICDYSR